MKCPTILITDLKIRKIVRFEEEQCYSANKGAIGTMKIKQKIKECSLQTSIVSRGGLLGLSPPRNLLF